MLYVHLPYVRFPLYCSSTTLLGSLFWVFRWGSTGTCYAFSYLFLARFYPFQAMNLNHCAPFENVVPSWKNIVSLVWSMFNQQSWIEKGKDVQTQYIKWYINGCASVLLTLFIPTFQPHIHHLGNNNKFSMSASYMTDHHHIVLGVKMLCPSLGTMYFFSDSCTYSLCTDFTCISRETAESS